MPRFNVQACSCLLVDPRSWLVGIAAFVAALVLMGCKAASPTATRSDQSLAAIKPPVSNRGPFLRVGALVGKSGYGDWRGDPIFSGNSHRFIALSNGDEKLAKATARVWDVATLQPICDPLSEAGLAYGLTFDGKIAFTTDDHSVRFWNVDSSKLICATRITDGILYDVAISPDGSRFLTMTKGEPAVQVWRLGETRPRIVIKQDAVYIAFDRTGTRILTYAGRETHIFSAETGKETCPRILAEKLTLPDLTALFDLTGRRLLMQEEAAFKVVDTTTGKTRFFVAIDEFYGSSENHDEVVRWSSDASKIVATSVAQPQPARIYDGATGKLERTFGTNVVDCWVAPGGRWAVGFVGPSDQCFHVWDLKSGEEVQKLNLTVGPVGCISPDCSTIVTMPEGKLDAIWRMQQNNQRQEGANQAQAGLR